MLKILIVDDSNFMRKNLGQLFISLGHNVVGEASNGLEAYEEYGKCKPDLVTMDVTMPKMEGIDAVKGIIGTYPTARIIMISAQSQKDVVFEAIKAGALTFLTKPVKADNIVKALKKIFPPEMLLDESKLDLFKNVFFRAELQDNTFHFTISNEEGGHPILMLPKAMDGIVMVKPLKVVINYEKAEKLPKEILDMIITDFKKIKEVGGHVEIISNVAHEKAAPQPA